MDDLGDTRCFSEKHLHISKVNASAISLVHDRSPFKWKHPYMKTPKNGASPELPGTFSLAMLHTDGVVGWCLNSWKFSNVVTTVLSNPLTVSRLRCGCEIVQTNATNICISTIVLREIMRFQVLQIKRINSTNPQFQWFLRFRPWMTKIIRMKCCFFHANKVKHYDPV